MNPSHEDSSRALVLLTPVFEAIRWIWSRWSI